MFARQKPKFRAVVPGLMPAIALRGIALACLVGLSGCDDRTAARQAMEWERIGCNAQRLAVIERCGHVGNPVEETVVCLAATGYSFREAGNYYTVPPVTEWSASSTPGLSCHVSFRGLYAMKERTIISFDGQVDVQGTGKGADDNTQKTVNWILRHLPIVH